MFMYSKFRIIGIILLLFFIKNIFAEQKFTRIVNLNGQWKFNLGDNKNWAYPNFDDSDWDNIVVPSSWENEGYNGYDGYAWYRKFFNVSSKYNNKKLYLSLGVIDDVAVGVDADIGGDLHGAPCDLLGRLVAVDQRARCG